MIELKKRLAVIAGPASALALLAQVAVASSRLSVLDGDTFDWQGNRIRIANIDAPELGHAKCDAERRLGALARKRLAELLASGVLEVIPGDPDTGRRLDRHGRLLAIVSIDGEDVGGRLIQEGYARPWEGRRRSWC